MKEDKHMSQTEIPVHLEIPQGCNSLSMLGKNKFVVYPYIPN